MKALAYLMGAYALGVARDADRARRSVPEPPFVPLATTRDTASAWRRWSQSRETPAPPAGERRIPSHVSAEAGRGPA